MGEIRNECGYDLLQAMNTGHGWHSVDHPRESPHGTL